MKHDTNDDPDLAVERARIVALQLTRNAPMKHGTRVALILFALPIFVAGRAFADLGGADIAKALDQKLARISITEQEMPAALAALGQQAGILIEVDEVSVDLLPWGRQTKLKNLTVENATLRDVLPQVLGALGMTYEIRDSGVFVVASEPLKRINRRATWDDIKLLRELNEMDYTPENFLSFKLQYRITSKVDAPGLLQVQLAKAGRGTVAQILETASGALGWVWFPNGDHIAIRTQEAQIANRMARRVTIKYGNEALSRILVDLADKAETAISFEPGMMLKLPQNVAQKTSLLLNQSSIRQAFELLAAETGIKYEIRRTGIYVGLSEQILSSDSSDPSGQRRAASSYVGKISVPSSDGSYAYDFLIRSDELPEDILEYRRQILEEYIQKMRADMAPNEANHSPGGAGQ